jgi:hypothetical protein
MVISAATMYFNRLLIVFFCILAGSSLNVRAEEPKPDEYQMKAVFLYNFAKFIDWPEESLRDKDTFNVCILGDSPFENNFKNLQGKAVRGKELDIKYCRTLQEITNCDLLFICSSEKKNLPRILRSLNEKNILTIGDTKDFAEGGVMINFYIEDDKVRFEVNLDAVKRSKLQISTKLLKIARVIKE